MPRGPFTILSRSGHVGPRVDEEWTRRRILVRWLLRLLSLVFNVGLCQRVLEVCNGIERLVTHNVSYLVLSPTAPCHRYETLWVTKRSIPLQSRWSSGPPWLYQVSPNACRSPRRPSVSSRGSLLNEYLAYCTLHLALHFVLVGSCWEALAPFLRCFSLLFSLFLYCCFLLDASVFACGPGHLFVNVPHAFFSARLIGFFRTLPWTFSAYFEDNSESLIDLFR